MPFISAADLHLLRMLITNGTIPPLPVRIAYLIVFDDIEETRCVNVSAGGEAVKWEGYLLNGELERILKETAVP